MTFLTKKMELLGNFSNMCVDAPDFPDNKIITVFGLSDSLIGLFC